MLAEGRGEKDCWPPLLEGFEGGEAGGGGGGLLNKVLYREALPRGSNPYPLIY